MKKGSLEARLAAIEAERRARGLAVLAGKLSAVERDELARLEAADAIEREKFRSGTVTEAEVDDWMHRHSIDGDDPSIDRLAELRQRSAG